jgi:hypothetical protein
MLTPSAGSAPFWARGTLGARVWREAHFASTGHFERFGRSYRPVTQEIAMAIRVARLAPRIGMASETKEQGEIAAEADYK